MKEEFTIRIAKDEDFEEILSIWIDGLSNSFSRNQIDKIDFYKSQFQKNFKERNSIFNFWVAVDDENTILSWQSLTRAFVHPFKTENFAESSTYISKTNRYKGVGKKLLALAIQEAQKSELEYIIGFVATNNESAKKITEETGFQTIGILPLSSKANNKIKKYILIKNL